MEINFANAADAEIMAFLVEEDGPLPAEAKAIDESSGGLLQEALSAARFNGSLGQNALIVLPASMPGSRAVLMGAGAGDSQDRASLQRIGAEFAKANLSSGFKSAAFYAGDPVVAAEMAAGVRLAAYRFDTYFTKRSKKTGPTLDHITFITDDVAAAEAAFMPLSASIDGTYFARDLVNEPPNILFPAEFARRLKELEALGVEVDVLGEAELGELGMGSMLGVGQGSAKESHMVVMRWNGGQDGDKPVALVGKGVCFDAGGISLKPGAGMQDMRGDMGGAAAVSGTMKAVATRQAKANVVGLVGLVENMPDGDAIRPGDILTSASGQTIEIQNTDAEGRLVLADVLWYTQTHVKPRCIVDLATLTGAIVIALGHHHAGLYANDDDMAEGLTAAGLTSGEPVWRMPMGREYDRLLKSQFADMRNIGGRAAGSITAAQFLQRFIDDGMPWAHLDIAGVAWVEGEKAPTDPSWASGFGPRLLSQWIADKFEA